MKRTYFISLNLIWVIPVLLFCESMVFVIISALSYMLIDYYLSILMNKREIENSSAILKVARNGFNYTFLILIPMWIFEYFEEPSEPMHFNFMVFAVFYLIKDLVYLKVSRKLENVIFLKNQMVLFNNIRIQEREISDLKSINLNGMTNRLNFKFKSGFLPFSYGLNQFEYVDLHYFVVEILKINPKVEVSENLVKKIGLQYSDIKRNKE